MPAYILVKLKIEMFDHSSFPFHHTVGLKIHAYLEVLNYKHCALKVRLCIQQ